MIFFKNLIAEVIWLLFRYKSFNELNKGCLRILLFSLLLLVSTFSLSAQNRYISMGIKGAGNLPGESEWGQTSSYFQTSANMRFGVQTTGNKEWHRLYNFPKVGVGLQYTTFTNPAARELISDFWSIYPYVSFPLVRKERFTFDAELAFGVGFGFNPWDSINNPGNVLIGTPVNAYISFGASVDYLISDRFELFADASLEHYSNGKLSLLNKGLNNITTSVGMRYYLNTRKIMSEKEYDISCEKKMDFDIMWNLGYRYTGVSNNMENRVIQAIQPTVQWTLNKRSRVGTGVDFMTYYTDNRFPMHLYRVGVVGTYEMLVGRFSGILQAGIWVYNSEGLGSFYYERAGVRYRLNDFLSLHLAIRAANLVADNIEWGLVFRI